MPASAAFFHAVSTLAPFLTIAESSSTVQILLIREALLILRRAARYRFYTEQRMNALSDTVCGFEGELSVFQFSH